jgi:chemotaxis signal transduction protein
MTAALNSAFLSVEAGLWRCAVAQEQVSHLTIVDPIAPPADPRGRPIICRDLGALLGGGDAAPASGRRHAITVDLRRRSVALLVDYIDGLGDAGGQAVQPLSPLLARRLARPWFLGAIIRGDQPLLLLDLRRIATDVALGAI